VTVLLLTQIARKDLMASGLGYAVMDAYEGLILKSSKMQLTTRVIKNEQ